MLYSAFDKLYNVSRTSIHFLFNNETSYWDDVISKTVPLYISTILKDHLTDKTMFKKTIFFGI